MRDQGARLKLARIKAGYRSASEAANENRWAVSTYGAHERGTRKMGEDDAEKYAKLFRAKGVAVTGQELLYGSGGTPVLRPEVVEQTAPALSSMEVLGDVEAGAWRAVAPHRKPPVKAAVRDPRFPEARQFLLRVRGDSMNANEPPLTEGSYVRCVDWADTGLVPRTGLLVVARRFSADHQLSETTVKRLKVFKDRAELWPESTNPEHKPIRVGEDDAEIIALVTGQFHEFEI